MKILDNIRKWLNNVSGYRMTTDKTSYKYPAYIVEVQGLFSWHTIKTFISDDTQYAKICATELLEMLKEDIEPK